MTIISKRRWMSLVSLLFFVCLVTVNLAHAASWILEEADTPQSVTEEQITELENKAKNGDWQLKEEFAAAYLYETSYPQIYGCTRLKYGHRCRAMAKQAGSAAIFLREILDSKSSDPLRKGRRTSFQEDYAGSLQLSPSSDPASDICREAIHYYELAVENGGICTARRLVAMARWGICMEKSEERAKAYRSKIPPMTGCPTP